MTGSQPNKVSRRAVLKSTAALSAALLAPNLVLGQGAPLRLGVLTPLTGAGGFDGPRML